MPVIIPIVIYHGISKWQAGTEFISLFKYLFLPDLLKRLEGMYRLFKELGKSKEGYETIEIIFRYIVNATEKITEEELKELGNKIPGGGDIMSTILKTIETANEIDEIEAVLP